MKKPNYTVTISYIQAYGVQTIDMTGALAETILAQAHAGEDLHWMDSDGEHIIPWGAVVSVAYEYTMDDVVQPVDSICGGVANLEVTLKEELPAALYFNLPCSAGISPIAYMEAVTYNGEDITEAWTQAYMGNQQAYASVANGEFQSAPPLWRVPVECGADSGTFSITYMYGGASTTVEITVALEGGFG